MLTAITMCTISVLCFLICIAHSYFVVSENTILTRHIRQLREQHESDNDLIRMAQKRIDLLKDECTANKLTKSTQIELEESLKFANLRLSGAQTERNALTNEVRKLRESSILRNTEGLALGLAHLVRFIGGNSWIIERYEELGDAFISVGEVAQTINERDDF